MSLFPLSFLPVSPSSISPQLSTHYLPTRPGSESASLSGGYGPPSPPSLCLPRTDSPSISPQSAALCLPPLRRLSTVSLSLPLGISPASFLESPLLSL